MRPPQDDGSAVVETVLVLPVLLALFLAVLQVGYAAHVRSTLAAAAAEGAHHGALVGNDADDARTRARAVAREALSPRLVGEAVAREEEVDGAAVLVVELEGRAPVVGPWVPGVALRVRGRALLEGER